MPSFNQVILMGNLTHDPDVRYTPSGTAVCGLRLAVNRRYSTRSGETREEVCYVDVDVWDRTAENCGRYLHKGDPVFVEGRLKLDEWEDRESGQKRSRLKVHANTIQFLSGPGGRGDMEDGGSGDQDYDRGGRRGGGGGYDRGGGGGHDRGGSRGGGGYDRGGSRGGDSRNGDSSRGGGYDRPPAENRNRSQGSSNLPPFPPPGDDGPAAKPPAPDDAFNVDDDQSIDDIPF